MSRKSAPLRHQPPADLFSYAGPPNGDYVRYVDRLMAWAEQEQARVAASAMFLAQPTAGGSGRRAAEAAPQGAAEVSQTAAEAWKAASAGGAEVAARLASKKPGRAGTVALLVFFVVLFIFAPDMAPLAIVLWVVWWVRRWLRSVSGKA